LSIEVPKEPQEEELRGKRRKGVSTIEKEKAFICVKHEGRVIFS
jgi:hypothetical protein